jgi:hypothetical protein
MGKEIEPKSKSVVKKYMIFRVKLGMIGILRLCEAYKNFCLWAIFIALSFKTGYLMSSKIQV